MDYIIQQTNPLYINFEIDILWAFVHGVNPAEMISKNPERYKLVHLKDLKKDVVIDLKAGVPKHVDVALGDGQIDIPAVIREAQKAGVEHFYIEDESADYLI